MKKTQEKDREKVADRERDRVGEKEVRDEKRKGEMRKTER